MKFSYPLFTNQFLFSGESLNARVELALMTSGLIAMNDALGHHRIDHRHRSFELSRRVVLFAGFDSANDALDGGTQTRTSSHVIRATLNRLTRALDCRFDIRHGIRTPKNRRRILPMLSRKGKGEKGTGESEQ
jgi:hypothetical protein